MTDASDTTVPPELLSRLFQSKMVPLLGAGCSAAAPSKLPPAGQLAELLVDQGAGTEGQALEDIAEAAWERGDWQEFAQLLPIDEWRARPPNQIVRVIAELCAEGLISTILTTNWDLLIETALNQIGQPYSKVVNATSLAVEPASRVMLVKLNGCIDHPELIKASRSDIESSEWLDAWVEPVFELVIRTNSMLFAGYSGASIAATTTISRIVEAGERAARDYVVDRQQPSEMAASSPTGERFMEAINLAWAFTGDADRFFEALRVAVHPLLLAKPARETASMSGVLLGPTPVAGDALDEAVSSVVQVFKEAESQSFQRWLLDGFASFPETEHVDPYLPLLKHVADVAKCFLLLAVTRWVERLEAAESSLGFALSAVAGGVAAQLPYLVVVCEPTQRRDSAAHRAAADFRHWGGADRRAVAVGVVFGGIGGVRETTASFSVARGSQVADAARGMGSAVAWIDGDALLSEFQPDAEEDTIKTALEEQLDAAAQRALQPAQ